MKRLTRIVVALLLLAVVALVGSTQAAQVGVWQLNNNLNNSVPGGAALSIIGGWTENFVGDTIGGTAATALSFPAMAANTQSLQMPNQGGANGGGSRTNEWTIVMDLKFPTIPGFISLWQTDPNIGANDGDFFVRGDGAIGISGSYHGTVTANNWHRIAVSVSHAGGTPTLNKYIDGALVGTTTPSGAVDDRHAVQSVLNLFGDEDGEAGAGLLNSLAVYNSVLTASEISALGAATAAGIRAIPEPSCLVLVAYAMGLLAAVRRARQS
jgi:hypothetical protein